MTVSAMFTQGYMDDPRAAETIVVRADQAVRLTLAGTPTFDAVLERGGVAVVVLESDGSLDAPVAGDSSMRAALAEPVGIQGSIADNTIKAVITCED